MGKKRFSWEIDANHIHKNYNETDLLQVDIIQTMYD